MATLRLFANLRELAGADRFQIDGQTVGEVVDAASQQFGSAFRDNVARARIWRNGDPVDLEDPVAPEDEIALIPPVSGGAEVAQSTSAQLESLVPLALAGVLVVANVVAADTWWPVAVVGVAALWVIDLTQTSRATAIPMAPALIAIMVSMAATHALGVAGLGLAIAAALVISFAAPVFVAAWRDLSTVAVSVVVAVAAAGAVSSLMLTRSAVPDGTKAVGVYLAVVIGTTLLVALFERLPTLPLADPIGGTAVGAVVLAVAAAAVWDLDLVTYVIVGIALAAALLAGRGFGSLVRLGEVALATRPPGLLSTADGAALAAGLMFPILDLVT